MVDSPLPAKGNPKVAVLFVCEDGYGCYIIEMEGAYSGRIT